MDRRESEGTGPTFDAEKRKGRDRAVNVKRNTQELVLFLNRLCDLVRHSSCASGGGGHTSVWKGGDSGGDYP